MGLTTRVRSTFLKVKNGLFLIANEDGDYVDVMKDGTTRKYDSSDGFDGYLKSVRYDDKASNKFGDMWIFDFVDDNGEKFTLQLGSTSTTAFGLLNRLAAIKNFGCLELTASQSTVIDKKGKPMNFTHVWVKNKLKGKEEEPKGLYVKEDIPTAEQVTDGDGKLVLVKGEPVISHDKKVSFFRSRILPVIQETLSNGTVADDSIEFTPDEEPDYSVEPIYEPTVSSVPNVPTAPAKESSIFDDDDGVPF